MSDVQIKQFSNAHHENSAWSWYKDTGWWYQQFIGFYGFCAWPFVNQLIIYAFFLFDKQIVRYAPLSSRIYFKEVKRKIV